MMLQISAIVCTYQRYNWLPETLESLISQTLPNDKFEVIVVDNSPDGDFSAAFSENYANATNLRWFHEETVGLSHARNVGVQTARGPIVAFIDDDAIAEADWLANIVATFSRFGKRAVALGGQVKPLWQISRPTWLHDDLLGYASVVNWGGDARIAREDEWVAGTNVAFRRAELLAGGGFSPALGRKGSGHSLISNEEAEVIERLRARDGYLLYDPGVVVNHLIDAERLTQQWFRRRAAWQATSDFLVDPPRCFASAPASWRAVQAFVNRLPPRDRSLRGLYVALEDPNMFKAQVLANYDMTISILAGFNDGEA
jgi:glycosyltransferase involved in cell wall biosynthesis